jgi:ABC-type transporter Mla MlaB component
MANINDLYNQLVAANGKLDTLNVDINNGTAASNQVRVSVDKLDTDLKAGFAATLNALTVLAQIDTAAVQLLFHLTQQADTMICELEHISKNTCAILTQVTIQTQLQTRIRDDADGLLDIAETANPAAALERSRLAALEAQIERCCPPPQPDPACTYVPCERPKTVPMPNLPKPGGDQPAGGTVG